MRHLRGTQIMYNINLSGGMFDKLMGTILFICLFGERFGEGLMSYGVLFVWD